MKIALRPIFAMLSFWAMSIVNMQSQTSTTVTQMAVGELQSTDDDNNGQQAVGLTIVERLSQPLSGVTVEAPDGLLQRALPQKGAEQGVTSIDEEADDHDAERVVRTKSGKSVGYRVQVFADNNARSAKGEARQRERAISQAFPSYATYVSYASPYWRLRVGDFRSQYDAEKAASEIRKAFPRYAREVRVVRDHISAR